MMHMIAAAVLILISLTHVLSHSGLGATFAEAQSKPEKPRFAVLVFSKTAGFRHDSIPAGVEALRKLGEQRNFSVEAT
jgi:cytochrome c